MNSDELIKYRDLFLKQIDSLKDELSEAKKQREQWKELYTKERRKRERLDNDLWNAKMKLKYAK